MSNDALLEEVGANLPIQLAVKAADSQFSQDQRVYTKVPTEVVHGGASGSSKKQRLNSHKSGEKKDETPSKSSKSGEKKDETPSKNSKSSKSKNRSRNRRSTSGENEIASLRAEVADLHEENNAIRSELESLRGIVQKLSLGNALTCQKTETAPVEKKAAAADEDFDLFESDEEDDEEKERIKQERLKAYAEKKSKKPGPIAKSSVILDVKPWDDETDLDEMEKLVKGIEMDGLLWGASKKVPIGYGISKLQIVCTVEDEKVSVDDLQDKIQAFDELVQSVDVVAFNKI